MTSACCTNSGTSADEHDGWRGLTFLWSAVERSQSLTLILRLR